MKSLIIQVCRFFSSGLVLGNCVLLLLFGEEK